MANDVTLNDGTVLSFDHPPSEPDISRAVAFLVEDGQLDPEQIREQPQRISQAPPPDRRALAELPEGTTRTPGTPGYYKSETPITSEEGFLRAAATTPEQAFTESRGKDFYDVIEETMRGSQAKHDLLSPADGDSLPREAEGIGSSVVRDVKEPFGEDIRAKTFGQAPAILKKQHGEFTPTETDLGDAFVGGTMGWYGTLFSNPADTIRLDPVESALEVIPALAHLNRLRKAAKVKGARVKAIKGTKYDEPVKQDPRPFRPAPIKPATAAEEAESLATGVPLAKSVATTEGVITPENFDQIMSAKVSDIEAVKRGVTPDAPSLPIPVTKSFEDALDQAFAEGMVRDADRIVESVIENPRPLSDAEGAAILWRGREIQDAHKAAQRQVIEYVDAGRMREAGELVNRMADMEDTFFDVMDALRRSATERGRALNAQKMMIGKDYDLISMVARATAANRKKLGPDDAKAIKRLADEIAGQTAKEKELIQAIADRLGQKVDDLQLDANGFPLQATDAELTKLMGMRTNAIDAMLAADLAALRASDPTKYFQRLAMDAVSTPKLLKASADFSSPGRQGLFLLLGKGSKGLISKAVARDLAGAARFGDDGVRHAYKAQREIINGDIAGLTKAELKLSRIKAAAARGAGVDYTSIGSRVDPRNIGKGGKLTKSEEQFAGNVFGDRGLRRLYKGSEDTAGGGVLEGAAKYAGYSERTYALPLNRLRKEKFMQLTGLDMAKTPAEAAEILEAMGKDNLDAIAKFVNAATGRGSLGGLQNAGTWHKALNALMFSPRFVASRAQTLARPITHGWKALPGMGHVKGAQAERIIMREYAHVASKLMAAFVLGNAALSADGSKDGVSLDRTSADFGKLRLGDTRWDVTGGLSSMYRLIATPLAKIADGSIAEYGQGVGTELERAFRGKLSPSAGLAADIVTGKDFKGDPVDPSLVNSALDLAVPISGEELFELSSKYGLMEGIARASPGIFGFGTSDYEDR